MGCEFWASRLNPATIFRFRYGNPGGATYYSLAEEDGNERAGTLDFYDTFLSEEHLKRSFPHMDVQVTGGDMKDDA